MYSVRQILIKKGHRFYPYCERMTGNAKNLYNIANFYIRQVYSGIQKDVSERHENEQLVMEQIHSIVPSLNNLKDEYYQKRLSKESKKPEIERKTVKKPSYFKEITKETSFLNYSYLDAIFKYIEQSDYYSLPGQTNQQVLKLLERDWKSFFKSNKDYKKYPSKYFGKPKPPKYAKKNGRKVAVLSNQTCKIKDGKYLRFPHTKYRLNIGKLGEFDGKLQEVRIVPFYENFMVEVVFKTKDVSSTQTEPNRVIAVDLGVNNFATISNNIGERPMIIKGKRLKSINQFYNKMRGHYYSILRQGKSPQEGLYHSKRLNRLDQKRWLKIKDFMHKASYQLLSYCVENQIDTIVIGKNQGWKQEVKMRKDDKQNFVGIPFNLFIKMVEYKAKKLSITVITHDESYTSKSSFLDQDDIPTYTVGVKTTTSFSGRRIKRGLYRSKEGQLINADVNASYNILRKAFPNALCGWNRGVVVSTPLMLSIA